MVAASAAAIISVSLYMIFRNSTAVADWLGEIGVLVLAWLMAFYLCMHRRPDNVERRGRTERLAEGPLRLQSQYVFRIGMPRFLNEFCSAAKFAVRS